MSLRDVCLCCQAAGRCGVRPVTALFEIDTNDLAAGPEQNIVFTDGTWQLDRSGRGRSNGQLSADDLALIQKDASAPWSSTPHTGITCHMVHAPTNYSANGKLVYSDTGCESRLLDDVSAKALAEIVAGSSRSCPSHVGQPVVTARTLRCAGRPARTRPSNPNATRRAGSSFGGSTAD